jgi:CheY-like chemotaxis protein
MLNLLLKCRGYKIVDQCSDGKEAVDCVLAKGNDYYDLIFLDNLMPIMVSGVVVKMMINDDSDDDDSDDDDDDDDQR